MKTLLNTNLFPILNVGMYNSNISPENLLNDDMIENDFENNEIYFNREYYDDNFLYENFKDAIQENASEILNDTFEVNGIKIKIECGVIYSPKQYNFRSDDMDLTVTFNKAKVLKFAKKNEIDFNLFLKENYSSYDGFCSFTSNNFFDWNNDFKVNDDRSIGAILTYIFKSEFKDLQDSFEELCYGNMFYSEFMNYEPLDAEIREVTRYAQINYGNTKIKELRNLFYFEILSKKTIKRIIAEVENSITNLTLKLDF